MVSNWMENETINQYIESDRDVNRINLVGFPISSQYETRLTQRLISSSTL